MKKTVKVLLLIILFLVVGGAAIFGAANYHVISTSKKYIKDISNKQDILMFINDPVNDPADYIIVLGASVVNGEPSNILYERLDKAAEVYNKGMGKKILVTGDSKNTEDDNPLDNYDETGPMKKYLIERWSIPEENIVVDKYGLCTYDSMRRALSLVPAGKNPVELRVIVVTQKYHLFRAVYDAKECGFDAYGFEAEISDEDHKVYNEMRELLGRVKDAAFNLFGFDTEVSVSDKKIGG